MRENQSDGREQPLPERLATWRAGRPVTGSLLLWATSALLVMVAIRPATIQITDTSLRGPLASVGALVVFAAGAVALLWPRRSTGAGLLGTVATLVVVPAIIALGSVGGMVELLGATVLLGAVGGLACTGWRPDRERRPSLVTRHGGTVAVLFALLIVLSSGAATAGQFPVQREANGGFILRTDTLAADGLDTRPNCRALLDDCNNITSDTRTRSETGPVGRQMLDGVSSTNFVISENLQESDGTWLNLEIRAAQVSATGSRGLDAYASEAYLKYIVADLTVFGDAVSIPIDEIQNRWICDFQEEANRNDPGGFGTLDDTRLGIDATPAVREGEDIYFLMHQVGTSETLMQDFELEINTTRKQTMTVDQDGPSFPDQCAS